MNTLAGGQNDDFTFGTKKTFVLAFLLLVIVNIIVGVGIWYNRSAFEADVWLTERELRPVVSWSGENNGLKLEINWRVLGKDNTTYPDYQPPYWLNSEKLAELGFDVEGYLRQSNSKNRRYGHRQLPRKVLLVLEAESAQHKSVLRSAAVLFEEARSKYAENPDNQKLKIKFEESQKNLERERWGKSRLFVIDAGLDQDTLRNKYPDRSRYLVIPGFGPNDRKRLSAEQG